LKPELDADAELVKTAPPTIAVATSAMNLRIDSSLAVVKYSQLLLSGEI
jgi:hypothetical protein